MQRNQQSPAPWRGLRARLAAWFDSLPIADALERQNARVVQIFCVGLALTVFAFDVPAALLGTRDYRQFTVWFGQLADGITVVVCALACVLIQRGRAAAAFRTLLIVFVGLLVASLLLRGAVYHEHFFVRVYAVLLVLAAMLIGRRALWTTLAALFLGLGLGWLHDHVWAAPLSPDAAPEGKLGESLPVVLLFAVLVDRFGVALRGAYAASRAREAELRHALARLREEAERRSHSEALLVEAQRLESLGRLSGGIAHDFNNILTVIRGFTDSAQREVPSDHPAQQDLAQVQNAAERAAGLTRQLLAIARRQIVRPRVLDVEQGIRTALPMLARVLGDGIALDTRFLGGPLCVRLDPTQLEQVLVNLAANARDAMPAGGRFRLELAPAGDAGEWVELAATDTGIGMDAATARRVFEPFFTTKEIGKGTGLGLATCHGIALQAGGTIAVESAPGLGSTFRMRLPRASEPPDAGEQETRAGGRAGRSENVLVVDDDAQIRALVANRLRAAGYRVHTADGPVAARELVARQALRPDLLLTDIVMATGDGHSLAEWLRAVHPPLRVLYMSGHPGEMLARADAAAAGNALLPKPFTPDALVARVDEVLAGRPQGASGA